jgi:cytochrome c oxidase cbb3-type subunit 3
MNAKACVFLSVFVFVLLGSACERETRRFRDEAAGQQTTTSTRMSSLVPGAATPDPEVHTFYEDNAYAISQGKRLYNYFNCVGCHANGGGGMGPPLMDDRWIYGSDPENIFATIVEGRPNGMPSFGGRIPADRIWWIVAYVRSLSGLTPKGASAARDDHMQYNKPQQRLQEEARPRRSTEPGGQ